MQLHPYQYILLLCATCAFYEHSQTVLQSSPSVCLRVHPSSQWRFIFPLPPPGTHYHSIVPKRRPILNEHGMQCHSKQPQKSTNYYSLFSYRLVFLGLQAPSDSLTDHMPSLILTLCFSLLTYWQLLSGIVKAQVNIMTRVRSLQTGVSGACAGMQATARCAVTIFSEYKRLSAVVAVFLIFFPCIYVL
jgi:hypothetical protein